MFISNKSKHHSQTFRCVNQKQTSDFAICDYLRPDRILNVRVWWYFYLLLLATGSMFTLTDLIRSRVKVGRNSKQKKFTHFSSSSGDFSFEQLIPHPARGRKNKAGTREHEEIIVAWISGPARHNLGGTLSQRVECVSWRTQRGAGLPSVQVAWKSSVYCPGRSHGEAETALRSGCWFTCERPPHIN